jgi:hypothetical protein
MILDREKIAELYLGVLDYDLDSKLPVLNKDFLDTICFIIEKNPEVVYEPNYGTRWVSTVGHHIDIKDIS